MSAAYERPDATLTIGGEPADGFLVGKEKRSPWTDVLQAQRAEASST